MSGVGEGGGQLRGAVGGDGAILSGNLAAQGIEPATFLNQQSATAPMLYIFLTKLIEFFGSHLAIPLLAFQF